MKLLSSLSETAAAVVLLLFSVSSAQEFDLTGTVRDSSLQEGIEGAIVSIAGQDFSDTTDSEGSYSISATAVSFSRGLKSSVLERAWSNGSRVFFGVNGEKEKIKVSLYSMSGRRLFSTEKIKLGRGNYSINPFHSELAENIYLVGIEKGKESEYVKIPFLKIGMTDKPLQIRTEADFSSGSMKKSSAVDDTLIVTAGGYETARKPITEYTGVNDFDLVWTGYLGDISVNFSYYRSFSDPMIITLEDPDLTSETASVKVTSESDTAGITFVLDSVENSPGEYNGEANFSIDSSDSALGLILVADGDKVYVSYSDAAPETTVVANAKWNGEAGSIQPGKSIYKGVTALMDLHLSDSDVMDSIVVIHVVSEKDTAGIDITLRADTASPGTFHGEAGFSLTQSYDDSIIAVESDADGDNLVLTYNDATPEGVRAGTLIWLPFEGSISYDSLWYTGYSSLMTVSVKDADITVDTLDVIVKSRKDTAGIIKTLSLDTTKDNTFSGSIAFTDSESSGDTIAVNAADTLSVIYYDEMPVDTISRDVTFSGE